MAVCSDDPSIPNGEGLYRWILEEWIVRNQATGLMRFSSAAFEGDEVSVDLSSLSSPEDSFQRGRSVMRSEICGVAATTAGQARELGQAVIRDPLPENPAHSLILGRKTHATKKKLAKTARWVFPKAAQPPGIP